MSDRRQGTPRATHRRRAAEDALLDAVLLPRETEFESVSSPGQTLLMKGLSRIERQSGVGGCVAWTSGANAEPRVLGAAPGRYATHLEITPERYALLASHSDLLRLTDPDRPESLDEFVEVGVTVVAPVTGLGSQPVALLLVFSEQPGRALRPRTVATILEVAKSLENSLSSVLALDRMHQLDDAVARLDRLSALGGLVSEIVHEIRNPLVSVKTFLQLLPDRLDDPEFHGDFRELVTAEVSRLERMLDDLLRQARPTEVRASAGHAIEGARIEDSIDTTLQLLSYRCRERGVELETKIAADLPAVNVSEDALRQLLLNLLLNATEVTEAGGSVRLTVDWSQREMNHVELLVEDEGPGIDSNLGSQLFEPFWTTRRDGAGGLGLAICKRIVEESEGRIDVHNNRRGGATFRVALRIHS